MKILLYLLLLLACGWLLVSYPFLFEIPLLLTIGGAYYLFFRVPTKEE